MVVPLTMMKAFVEKQPDLFVVLSTSSEKVPLALFSIKRPRDIILEIFSPILVLS